MAFVDWYVPKPITKDLKMKEQKALQCLFRDDDESLRQLLESGEVSGNLKIRYWSSDRTLFHLALVAHRAARCGKQKKCFIYSFVLIRNSTFQK